MVAIKLLTYLEKKDIIRYLIIFGLAIALFLLIGFLGIHSWWTFGVFTIFSGLVLYDFFVFDKEQNFQAWYKISFAIVVIVLFLMYLFLQIKFIAAAVVILLGSIIVVPILYGIYAVKTFLSVEKLQKIRLWYLVGLYLGLVFIIISIFAIVYLIPFNDNNYLYDGNKIIDASSSMYFSSVTFYTLGYGDIVPKGDWFRLISQIEVLFGAIINIIFVAWVLRAKN